MNQYKVFDNLGIAASAQARAERFAAANPALARRILGLAPDYSNARETRIVVNLKSGERLVERNVSTLVPKKAAARISHARRRPAPPPPRRPLHWSEDREEFRTSEMRGEPGARLRIRDILDVVAELSGIEAWRLTAGNPSQVYARPRQISVLLARELRPDLTTPQLGFLYGRHHTSILSAEQRALGLIRRGDHWMADLYERSKAEITERFHTQEAKAA